MSEFGLGNNGRYHGNTLAEIRTMAAEAERKRFSALALQLIDLIGDDEYDAFVEANWPDNGITWTKACALVEKKIAEVSNERADIP